MMAMIATKVTISIEIAIAIIKIEYAGNDNKSTVITRFITTKAI